MTRAAELGFRQANEDEIQYSSSMFIVTTVPGHPTSSRPRSPEQSMTRLGAGTETVDSLKTQFQEWREE